MMKKMNIAIVCVSVNLQNAGSLVSTWRFATNLAKRGHQVLLISTGKVNSVEVVEGVKVIRFKAWPTLGTEGTFRMLLFASCKKIKKIFVEENVEIVHFMLPTPLCFSASKAAKELNLPLIGHSHTQPENMLIPIKLNNQFLNRLFYRYLIWFYSRANVIVCPTKFAQQKMIEHGLKIKTTVISNGVELDKFKPAAVPEKFYKDFAMEKKDKHILFVGRIWPEKNIPTLIKALPLILEKIPKAHLDIVGKKENHYSSLKRLVKKLGLEEKVTFLGKVSPEDLNNAYNACTVFCLPSYVELEGMVVLEAMACGKPIIVSNSPQSASQFYVNGNGYVFKADDPKDLAEKIVRVLSDESLQKKMTSKSLNIVKGLTMEKSIRKLEELYAQWI